MRVRTRDTATRRRTSRESESSSNQWLDPLDTGSDSHLDTPHDPGRLPLSQPGTGSHRIDTLSIPGPEAGFTVTHPSDTVEQQAARIASRAASPRPASAPEAGAPLSAVPHARGPEDPSRQVGGAAESLVRTTLGSHGMPLSPRARDEMESLLNHDFSKVRVHTDEAAARSASAVSARAYTVGTHIAFGANRYAPGTGDGDRLLAHELAHVAQQTGRVPGMPATASGPLTLARDFEVPAAPVTLDAPAEREKEKMPESDKERARTMLIAPLRAAANELGEGEKADVSSVLRHLRPMRPAAASVRWPDSSQEEVSGALDDLDADKTMLESLKLGSKETIVRAHHHWLSARRELAAAKKALRSALDAESKHPNQPGRDGLVNDANAATALLLQVEATIQDLAKAPRTQEGFQKVEETADGLLPQFDSVTPIEAAGEILRAKDAFTLGIATLAPLALGKEETLKQAQQDLNRIADQFAQLVGDAPASPKADPEKDDESDLTLPPAPSPTDLPPPPPPPAK